MCDLRHTPGATRADGDRNRHAPALVHCHTGRANWVGGLGAGWEGLPAMSTRRMDRPVMRGLRTRWLIAQRCE